MRQYLSVIWSLIKIGLMSKVITLSAGLVVVFLETTILPGPLKALAFGAFLFVGVVPLLSYLNPGEEVSSQEAEVSFDAEPA